MSKSEPTAAQARYRMRLSTHVVPDSARKSVSKFNRFWLGKAMAFVAVFSMVFSSFGIPTPQAKAAAPNWNATGAYVFRFVLGGDYDYNVNLSQDGSGALTGTGTYPVGGPTSYSWTLSSGSVDGNTISFVAPYTAGPDALGATMNVTGTITAGGNMSGTWTDNYQGGSRAGTWSAVSGTASPIAPSASTVVITGNTTNTENTQGKWMFNRDASTDTPFIFNTGNASIGSGSLSILPIGPDAEDKMVAEYFINKPITDINGVSYDFKIGAGGIDTQEEQFYMSVYANFGSSDDLKFYDCRYDVVPTVGSTTGYTTVSFDPTQSYSVTTRAGGDPSPTVCPAVPADMNTFSAGSNIRMFALNVGDTSTSDIGLDGYLDKVVVDTDSDGTTTFDFEAAAPRISSRVAIQKVWQNAAGQSVAAPDNKDDITITVTTENGNQDVCRYNANGVLECDGTVTSYTDETIEVVETGLPTGWEVDSTTVGDTIIPVCPERDPQGQKSVDCTHTVVNKQKTVVPCSVEMVVNGGFELPEVTNGAQWELFPSGTPGMGWSVDNAGTSTNGNMELQEGVLINSHGGNQLAEVDSDMNVTMYQDLITQNTGVYTVSLWTHPRPGIDAADNAMEVRMGGTVLGVIAEDGTGQGPFNWTQHTFTFIATGGVSRLEITGTGSSNALGGLVDDVSVKQDCLSDVTICKLDQNQNPLSGWDVFLKGLIADTVVVSGTSNTPVLSDPLAAGDYILEASGTYTYRGADRSDAAYSERQPSDAGIDSSFYSGDYLPWVRNLDLGTGYAGYLGIRVDGTNFNWGTKYNSSHEYAAFKNVPTLAPLSFYIEDGNSYADNAGSLTVDIYPVIKGTTGQNGCVTLQDVDYGTYDLDELMQDGWENVSGKGTDAVVDQPTENFTLVNQCTSNCVSTVKICKLNDQGTPLPGWNVFLKGPRLETVEVDSADVIGSTTANVLEAGQEYAVEIEGEWQNRGFETVDASYTTPDSWATVLAAPQGGYPDDLLETQINQAFVNWGPYSGEPDHKYSLVMTGTGSTANFRVYDAASGNPTDMSSAWYGDNDGELTVRIYPIYQGTTGADGCVTIDGVPFGTYTLGETMQEGWENERGEGSTVIVNEPYEPGTNLNENPFVLVNTCTGEGCQEIQPCTVTPINVISGAATFFSGLKEGGSAPIALNNANNYPSGTTGVAQPAAPTGFAGAWDGSINDPDIAGSGAVYVSNDATQPTLTGGPGFDGSVDSWRLFKHTFTIPAGATNISLPTLHFAADNEVSVFLDEAFIGFNNSFSTVVDTAPLALTPGTHTLEFAVKNYAFDQTNNPTGVIYKLDSVTYECPPGGGEEDFYSVNGLVYTDSNQDGIHQVEEESGLAGMTVKLFEAIPDGEDEDTDLDETEIASDVSDTNGLYSFDLVPAGCYIVREIPDGFTQTEPAVTGHEYYINVGGADCVFNNPDEGFEKLTSLFFKTAQAATVDTVFVAYNNEQLKFGNYATTGGGSGGNGGSSSGSSSNNNDPETPLVPTVLGDSTTVPSTSGQVLGATTLPRTGSPLWVLLIILTIAAPVRFFGKLAFKKA